VRDGREVEALTIGEIWLSGPSVAAGYLNRPEETARTFGASLAGEEGSWLRTGDLGFVDADGFLFVTGRVKDTLVVFGRNHYPQDLEETVESAGTAIRPHFVAVFAQPTADRERITVVAEIRRGAVDELAGPPLTWSILRKLSDQHEIQADEVWLVRQGQVPKTTSGKIRRASCREMLESSSFEVLHGWQRQSP
jgi:acyl-CoA synthetase (AMP-forming)/AMP-acid ligase II